MADELTPNERAALGHWSTFGQKGEPPKSRVLSSECKAKPFVAPITSPWNQMVPRDEISKVLNGFRAEAMEDKWVVYADGPDAQGRAVVHMCRSWTGHKILELKFQLPTEDDGPFVDGDAWITEIIWESSQERYRNQTEAGAKELAKQVCKWCMDVCLP